jgi:hypothetical protein
MFIAIFWENSERTTLTMMDENDLKEHALNDPNFPTEEAVIHKICDTTFEVIDTFKFRLTQL